MSVRLKRLAARALGPTGMLQHYSALKSRQRHQLLLLGYHRVLPLEDEPGHPGDVELISATPAEFAWQVEYLCRHFEPVTFAQIAEMLDGNTELPRRALAVTFDDGFADVYEHAFPVLQSAQIPATVFVTTEYIGQPKPFWFDLVTWVIFNAPSDTVVPISKDQPLMLGNARCERQASSVTYLKWLKNCDEERRRAAVEEFFNRFPEIVAAGIEVLGRALSWDQMREMAGSGIEFGSHTVSHRCLAKLSPTELKKELVESKRVLESNLNCAVTALAYPFGGTSAFDDNVISVAKKAGYRVAASYLPGVNLRGAENRYALLRQHVERDVDRQYFKAMVHAPTWFQ